MNKAEVKVKTKTKTEAETDVKAEAKAEAEVKTKAKAKAKARLFGQESIFQSIRESFNDLPHIFITGPPGCGKTTFLEDVIEMI